MFPHQRWKIWREIFVVITIIFTTPVKKLRWWNISIRHSKYFFRYKETFHLLKFLWSVFNSCNFMYKIGPEKGLVSFQVWQKFLTYSRRWFTFEKRNVPSQKFSSLSLCNLYLEWKVLKSARSAVWNLPERPQGGQRTAQSYSDLPPIEAMGILD